MKYDLENVYELHKDCLKRAEQRKAVLILYRQHENRYGFDGRYQCDKSESVFEENGHA